MIYFGTSIGIAIRGDDLEMVCARGRWKRAVVTGFLRVEKFLSRPQAEVAELYRRFRKENHATATSATVALPRGAALIRFLEFPSEVAPNLAQAVEYQVDLLHPFEEGSMAWDWALLPAGRAADSGQAAEKAGPDSPGVLRVAVALAEKQAIEKLAAWFAATGIDVACFTFASAAMYRALGSRARPSAPQHEAHAGTPAKPLVLLDGNGATIEVLGIGADGRFYSREVPASAALEREVALCAADLRLAEGEYEVVATGQFAGERPASSHPLEEVFAGRLPAIRPPGPGRPEFRLAEAFAAYAAALPGLELQLFGLVSRGGLKWNLLPPDKRVYRSHWAYSTAWLLAVVVLGLAGARLTTGWVQDRYYSSWLDSQIRALAPRVTYLERLDSKQKSVVTRIETLERERRNVARKIEVWREVTRLLPRTAWVQTMNLTENQVVLAGQADTAGGLLQTLSQSPYFEQAEFLNAVGKNNEGRETFQIRIRLRETPLVSALPGGALTPPAAPVTGAAASPAAAANGGKGGK